MSKAVQYVARTYTIEAGDIVEIARDSAFLTCLTSTGNFKLRFNDGSETRFEAGLTYRPASGFLKVSARNHTAQAITVTFGFGKGEITDSRVNITNAIDTNMVAPNTLATGDPVNVTTSGSALLAAANNLRREVMVINTDATAVIYVNGSFATAGQGIPVLAGQSLTLSTSAAIYARNDSGGAVSVAVAELVAS